MKLSSRLLAFFVLLICGCGSAAPSVTISSPFLAEHRLLFDDGADFFDDPVALQGAWRDASIRDTYDRVDAADLVVVVTIDSSHADSDPSGLTSYRLVGQVERNVLGAAAVPQLNLLSGPESPGYATIRNNGPRLLNSRFVVYLKWYTDAEGEIRSHWHLSPASNPVLIEVERAVARTLSRRGQS